MSNSTCLYIPYYFFEFLRTFFFISIDFRPLLSEYNYKNTICVFDYILILERAFMFIYDLVQALFLLFESSNPFLKGPINLLTMFDLLGFQLY